MTAARSKMWQGINYVEGQLTRIHNKLSYIIVPQKWVTPDSPSALTRSFKDLEDAIEAREWLAALKAPRVDSRHWVKWELQKLDNSIARATNAFNRSLGK